MTNVPTSLGRSGLFSIHNTIIMTGELDRADQITKLILAVTILTLYMSRAITGPFAKFLLVLAGVVVMIFLVKIIIAITTSD
jgi:hypothetical protein